MQKPERWLSLGETLYTPELQKPEGIKHCMQCGKIISLGFKPDTFFCSDVCFQFFKEKHPEIHVYRPQDLSPHFRREEATEN